MAKPNTSMQIVLESLRDVDIQTIQRDLEDNQSRVVALLQAVNSILKPQDLPKVRVIITGSFIASVSSRQGKIEQEYTVERGSGVVVGKTMPVDKEGIVDMLFPLHFLLLESNDIADIQHIAKHEAVHAHIHLLSPQPFETYTREKFGEAIEVFMKMAGDLTEEYLAEHISVSKDARKKWADKESISDALNTMEDTLNTKLSAIPEDAEDYYGQLMTTTFGALYILWKALAFLAVELRVGGVFQAVPEKISGISKWESYVAPDWDEYLGILGEIPIDLNINVEKTDAIVKKLASHLQQWALRLGFDFHDTPEGQGWFQIT